jgi:acyl carrier protein
MTTDLDLPSKEIASRISTWVKSTYVSDPDLVLPMDTSLLQTGLIDSFAFVNLITYLETEFEIAIPDEDITPEVMGSINKMATYITKRKFDGH